MNFLALDFETSGLDPKRHAPVTLGVASFQNDVHVGGQEWLIAPPTKDGRVTKEYDACALEISGYSLEGIRANGKPADMVLRELSAFMREYGVEKDSPVVAFNAPFDYAFWSELLFQAGNWNQHLRRFDTFVAPVVGPWHCARMLAMWLVEAHKVERWNLDSVAAHFGFARTNEFHGALEDAVLAGRIFAELTKRSKVAA